MVILEMSAGSDPERLSEDLTTTVRAMIAKMARVAVLAWPGLKEPMNIPH